MYVHIYIFKKNIINLAFLIFAKSFICRTIVAFSSYERSLLLKANITEVS